MKAYLECIPCFFRQALTASRIAGMNLNEQKGILDDLSKIIPEIDYDTPPPQIARFFYHKVNEFSPLKDAYNEIKRKSNILVLGIYEELKTKIKESENSLKTAVELAIAGNIIDYGINSLNVIDEINKIMNGNNDVLQKSKSIHFDYDLFESAIHKSKEILYLGDNAGEIVFDKLLLDEIKRIDPNKKIIYTVKEKPIINDALIEDAYQCGLDQFAEIISSGSDAPGTVLSLCNENFINLFNSAELIISKGMGNFESLSHVKGRPIFFLFIVKCEVVARNIGGSIRDIILKKA